MTRTRMLGVAGLTLAAFVTEVAAQGLQCSGEVNWAGLNTRMRLDIEMPTKIDAAVSLPTAQGSTKSIPVGRGRIEIREVADGATESRESDFYVTSTHQGVITGFFVEGTLVYVVRFSPRAKVFSFFDSFRERLIAGSCA